MQVVTEVAQSLLNPCRPPLWSQANISKLRGHVFGAYSLNLSQCVHRHPEVWKPDRLSIHLLRLGVPDSEGCNP